MYLEKFLIFEENQNQIEKKSVVILFFGKKNYKSEKKNLMLNLYFLKKIEKKKSGGKNFCGVLVP